MKKLASLSFVFLFISSCTTAIKTQRPELADPPPITTAKKPTKKDHVNPAQASQQTPGTAVGANPSALVGLAAEEMKVSQFEKANAFWDAFLVSSALSTTHTDPKKSDFIKLNLSN